MLLIISKCRGKSGLNPNIKLVFFFQWQAIYPLELSSKARKRIELNKTNDLQ